MPKSVAQRFAEFRLRKGKLTVKEKEKNGIAEIRKTKRSKVDEDKQEEYRRKERNIQHQMNKKEANLKESIEQNKRTGIKVKRKMGTGRKQRN